MNFSPEMFGSGLGGFLGGMFGDSGAPYDKAMDQYRQWGNKGADSLNPYANAGRGAIGNFEDWLGGQKDPSKFINDMMGQYKESPYAQYLQQQSMRAGQNAASASGMMGSTPLMEQLQRNSSNIASGDMNNWLKNVLGINTQYGQGESNLMQGGLSASNSLADLYNKMGQNMGEQSYNKEASKQNNFWNTMGGIGSMIGSFFL